MIHSFIFNFPEVNRQFSKAYNQVQHLRARCSVNPKRIYTIVYKKKEKIYAD